MKKEINLFTLFSGIGSPEQGALRVYDRVNLVGACEIDKYARISFKANYKIDDKHFHKDIYKLDGTQYKGKVDILVGGSPCQDFSLAGLRAGIDGDKGILIYEYIRIIQEIEPPIFIYENVKGMLSDKDGRTIKEFVQAFRDMGYFCHYEVLNTKDYGVPQNRERIFLVGFKDVEHYYRFGFAPKVKLEKRLKDVLEDEVDEKYYLSDKSIKYITDSQRLRKKFTSLNGDVSQTLMAQYSQSSAGTFLCVDSNGRIDSETVGTITSRYYKGVEKHGGNPFIQIKSATKKGYELATNGDSVNLTFPKSKTRRGRVGKQISQTLDCACNQGVVENCKIRKLTPRECFRLQDFPDSFKFVASNSQLYKQAGNSISVNVIEMIFRQIEKSRLESCNKESLF